MGVATSLRPAKSKTQQMEQTQCKVAWQCALSVSEVMPSRNPAAEEELQPAECLLALATHLCSGIVSMYAYHMIPYVHIFMYILYCTYISLCMILFAGIGICFIFSLCEEKLQWKLQTAWLRDRVTDYVILLRLLGGWQKPPIRQVLSTQPRQPTKNEDIEDTKDQRSGCEPWVTEFKRGHFMSMAYRRHTL